MTAETWHELSVRSSPVGGPVWPEVKEGPPDFVLGRARLVLLVHGFNVNLFHARDAYRLFGDRLKEVYGGDGFIDDFLGKFHWPGDANLGPVSFASYPFEITDAKNSAKKLAGYLRGLWGPDGGPIQLDIVADSLGCRVVLETIRELLQTLRQLRMHLGVVCLMAAAVPVDMLDKDGQLAGTLDAPQQVLILHSTGDLVLHYAFPLGETMAGEGFFPTALGRFGPLPGTRADHEALNELGHSDYWGAETAARKIAPRLSLRPAGERVLERSLPQYETPTRELPTRDLPTYQGP